MIFHNLITFYENFITLNYQESNLLSHEMNFFIDFLLKMHFIDMEILMNIFYYEF